MAFSDIPFDIILLIAMASNPCDAYNLFLAYGWSKKDIEKEMKRRKDVFIYDGETKVSKNVTNVIIPDSVTTIKRFAFDDCTSLTTVSIPDSVTSIGYHAFEDCTSLTSVTIPNSITFIDNAAFSTHTKILRK